MTDTWDHVAIPILRWVAEHEGLSPTSVGDLSDALGLDPAQVVNELHRLTGNGYLAGTLHQLLTGGTMRPWFIHPTRLGERGARIVGLWPPEDPGDALMQVLAEAEENERDPERKSRLAAVRQAVGGLAKEVLTDIVAKVVTNASGL